MFSSILPRLFARPHARILHTGVQLDAPAWPATEPAPLDGAAILGDFLLDEDGPAAHRMAMYAPTVPASLTAF